jgi:hypothetical protein
MAYDRLPKKYFPPNEWPEGAPYDTLTAQLTLRGTLILNRFHVYAGLAFAACIALAGCNGSTSPSPSPTPQFSNISGDYTGTVSDAQAGNGTATATLAQTGSSAGGAITITQTSGTIVAQTSLTITTSNALSGTMVVNYADGTTCTFHTTGTYTNNGSSSAVINGSYSAVTNCAGDTGSYTLNQQCTDTITDVERRTLAYPAHC